MTDPSVVELQEDYRKESIIDLEDASFKRIRIGITWGIGLILFVTVIIYAGIRGQYAYNHNPALQINFQSRSTVKFPAVTVCPIEPSVLSVVECVKETGPNDVFDCSSTVYVRSFSLEGSMISCLTFNDPQDGSQVVMSNSLSDELEIQVSINNTQGPVGEPTGILVIMHDQGVLPELEEESSFVATLGELTETWLSLNEIHYLSGVIENDFKGAASAALIKENSLNVYSNLIAVALSYTQQGVYVNQEYYVYTPDNWIGEVGGLTCLLYFLHWVVTGTLLFAIGKIRGRSYKKV